MLGGWWLVVGCWLLVAGSLLVGCSLLANTSTSTIVLVLVIVLMLVPVLVVVGAPRSRPYESNKGLTRHPHVDKGTPRQGFATVVERLSRCKASCHLDICRNLAICKAEETFDNFPSACMYMHVYMYIYIYTHTYIHTFIHTHIHTHIHIHICGCVRTHAYIYIYIYKGIYIYIQVCTCISICICTTACRSPCFNSTCKGFYFFRASAPPCNH